MAHGKMIQVIDTPKFMAIMVVLFCMGVLPCAWLGGAILGQFDIFLFDSRAVHGKELIHVIAAYPTTFASIGWIGGALFALVFAFLAAYNNGCRYVEVHPRGHGHHP